jgi:Amidases related to nicotinamidase
MDVLLVMNPQNSFLDKAGTMYLGEKAETLKVRLADLLKDFARPKIFFREVHAMEDNFFSADKTHSIATTSDVLVEESLKKYADMFMDKARYSAVYETRLDTQLKQMGAHKIGIVGLETHTSVLFTAEKLRNMAYDVTVIEPCTMSRDDYLHGYAITLMKHFLGVKISNE